MWSSVFFLSLRRRLTSAASHSSQAITALEPSQVGAEELMLLNRGAGKLLRVPWTARRSDQSILKETSPEYSWEGLMLKLKLQYSGHLMRRTDSIEETLMLGKTEGRRRRGWQRMRWLDGITDSMTWAWANWEIGKDRKAWRAAAYGVAKSQTRLSDWTTCKQVVSPGCLQAPQTIHLPRGTAPPCRWECRPPSWEFLSSPDLELLCPALLSSSLPLGSDCRDDHTKWNKTERNRQIPHGITYMWNIKCNINELIYETERDSQT